MQCYQDPALAAHPHSHAQSPSRLHAAPSLPSIPPFHNPLCPLTPLQRPQSTQILAEQNAELQKYADAALAADAAGQGNEYNSFAALSEIAQYAAVQQGQLAAALADAISTLDTTDPARSIVPTQDTGVPAVLTALRRVRGCWSCIPVLGDWLACAPPTCCLFLSPQPMHVIHPSQTASVAMQAFTGRALRTLLAAVETNPEAIISTAANVAGNCVGVEVSAAAQ